MIGGMVVDGQQAIAAPLSVADIGPAVRRALDTAPITDIHTHLYPPQFGELCLWGIDELLTYHYLVAEMFRVARPAVDPENFFHQPKVRQAECVWRHLFVERSPISEAALGLAASLARLGLDPAERDLNGHRRRLASRSVEQQIDDVLRASGVRTLIMTNSPFDDVERPIWQRGAAHDSRFKPALRLDPLVNEWPQAAARLQADGYRLSDEPNEQTINEVRRFVSDWSARMSPLYVALSLAPEFCYPARTAGVQVLERAIIPVAEEHGLPVALMIGVRRQVNPALRLAGDAVGLADVASLGNLCAAHPRVRFLCTLLARENQHELTVTARKFANLHIFGCWWFVNTASLTDEITRMRMELLGHSFTPQHSDARVLEQLIYKWADARKMLGGVLTERYERLAAAGWTVTAAEIEREAAEFLGGTAMRFIRGD